MTGNNPTLISDLLKHLHTAFLIRDLGEINCFLGIQANRVGSALHLTQSKYIQDLLIRSNMEDAKPVSTPGCHGKHFPKTEGTLLPIPLSIGV